MKLTASLVAFGILAVAAPVSAAPPPTVPPTPEATPVEVSPYDPAGRRDPFRPFLMDAQRGGAGPVGLTPLQRFDLGQLRVVGTIWALKPPRAMIEDSSGMGYIVTTGTPIGRRGGVVTAIEDQRVVVEERVVDFYGNEQVNRVIMETPKEEASSPAGREQK